MFGRLGIGPHSSSVRFSTMLSDWLRRMSLKCRIFMLNGT